MQNLSSESSIIICLFQLLFAFGFVASSFGQEPIYCIDLQNTTFENYEDFNHDIEGKKLIILGERHYMVPNSILQVDLLVHLNREFGIRHMLIEFGQAEAYLYNKYLDTGDKWYLKYTYPGFNGHKEFFSSWEKLYLYNSKLDSDRKIVVHGLDLEREPSLTASMLDLFSNSSKEEKEIDNFTNSLCERLDTLKVERDTKDYIYFLRENITDLPKNENSEIIEKIIGNNSFYKNFSERDKNMANSFKSLDTLNESYFGQFGFGHTMLNFKGGFVNLLDQDEHYHKNILVINMHYIDNNDLGPFDNIGDCPVFLFKPIQITHLNILAKREHWGLVLKNQKEYKRE